MANKTGTRNAAIVVENGNWGAVSLSAVRAVLESACAALTEAFEKEAEDAIRVTPWHQEGPLVVRGRRPYRMYLSARGRYWSRYVRQFSRELCRVLISFDRSGSHRHRWFEESLCRMSSLFVLHRLAESWKENPPACVLKAAEFAPYHAEYAERIEAEHALASGENIAGWLARNIRTLEASPAEGSLNAAAAVALLDHFRCDPSLWKECGLLNLWDAAADATFSDYLDSWSDCLKGNGLEGKAPDLARKLFCPVGGQRPFRGN